MAAGTGTRCALHDAQPAATLAATKAPEAGVETAIRRNAFSVVRFQERAEACAIMFIVLLDVDPPNTTGCQGSFTGGVRCAGSNHALNRNGSIVSTEKGLKSAEFRVATVSPHTNAVAAINASSR